MRLRRSGLRQQVWRVPCGSGLGRDAAMARRRLRFRLQSRASSLPQTRALAADRECSCGSGLGRDTRAVVRQLRYRPLSGSEDPSHGGLSLAPLVDQARSLWERPWPRQGLCRLQASLQAAVGVRRPLPQNPAQARAAGLARSLRERPWPRQGLCSPQVSLQVAVGVRRPLPQGLTLTPLVDQARSWWERPWPRQGVGADADRRPVALRCSDRTRER